MQHSLQILVELFANTLLIIYICIVIGCVTLQKYGKTYFLEM